MEISRTFTTQFNSMLKDLNIQEKPQLEVQGGGAHQVIRASFNNASDAKRLAGMLDSGATLKQAGDKHVIEINTDGLDQSLAPESKSLLIGLLKELKGPSKMTDTVASAILKPAVVEQAPDGTDPRIDAK